MLCWMQLCRWKQWAEIHKAFLGRSSAWLGQLRLTCIRSHIFMAGTEFHSFFLDCDILIYVEMTHQTRSAWLQNECATVEIEDTSFFLRFHRTPYGVNTSYLCLNHAIGLCQCFIHGPQKGPSWWVGFQWAQSLASISLEERFLKSGGRKVWWRGARHKL